MNQFKPFWNSLKGKGEKTDRRSPVSLYGVKLSKEEIERLTKLAEQYPEVKQVVERTEGNTVFFRAHEAVQLARKSRLKTPRRHK